MQWGQLPELYPIGRLQTDTNQRWLGKGEAYQSDNFIGPAQLSEVHRLKVDTEKMLLVTTGEAEPGSLSYFVDAISALINA